ncbi:competence protein ComFA [Paenibacillus harenae]|uniref:Competence protein ComFA n=2 Tax=Paenibacillus harenae TaxID=306543 RepID=A0ABT9UBC0_PAEHA|nr:competence protein ComFA [Paenibacillus harenae]
MRAYVYVICIMGKWKAYSTIAPVVDRLYWLHESAGQRMGRAGEAATEGWLWLQPLPLGDACRAAALWNLERERRGGGRSDREDVPCALAACVAAARKEAVGARRSVRAKVQQGDSLRGGAERWERAALAGELEGGGAAGDSAAAPEGLGAAARRAAALLQGRALLRSEAQALLEGAAVPGADSGWSDVLQLAALLGLVRLHGSVAASIGNRRGLLRRSRRELRCLRCGSGEPQMRRTACASCGRECAYCSSCIQMGRSRECELLIEGHRSKEALISARQLHSIEERLSKWKLSPAQSEATAKALQFVESPSNGMKPTATAFAIAPIRSFLLWAVTGAGKTEMIFPLMESILLRGGKALIATPRRDVVIELDPRIRKAFPTASIVTLYGGSEQRWERGDITLATTHQLLRFQQSFDLVVIDELDAFPYINDETLHYAADKCCAPCAVRLLLSATPPLAMQRDARRGALPHARIPVRYHRHPLPVPKLLRTPMVAKLLQSRRLPVSLLSELRRSVMRGAQLFVFVQRIAQAEPMADLLRSQLRLAEVAATSSQDDERSNKVKQFREGKIRVLVTTTILERGVTIPRSDVYILDADGRLFDEASLVQMAGRAGRSADDPAGRVFFCSREHSRSQARAVSHIKAMNRMARKQGYLLPEPASKEVSR